jgi:hypothetical protein
MDRIRSLLAGVAVAATTAFMASTASAAVVFTSTFESVPGGPTPGTFVWVTAADGWTADGAGLIELQNHKAGDPAPGGGDVFVELDSNANSSMSRIIGPGTYDLSFLYSARPNRPSAFDNAITVSIGGSDVGLFGLGGGAVTNWVNFSVPRFTVAAPTVLTFSAVGTSNTFGGYLDNITLSAVPEPAAWATMILGFGGVGAMLRSRRRRSFALAAA